MKTHYGGKGFHSDCTNAVSCTCNCLTFLDPNKLAKCQESLEVSRRRMQENLDAKAKEFAEKKREVLYL